MSNEISNECSAIAFYGVEQTPEAISSFYGSAVEWFEGLGLPPDQAAIHGPGHSGKYVSFKHANAKVAKSGFSEIIDVELSSLAQGGNTHNYLATAFCSSKLRFIYFVARSSFAELSHAAMLPIAKRIIACARPKYGMGYRRDFRLGPAYYAMGLSHGLGDASSREGTPEREEALRISFWSSAMDAEIWRRGLLRDVYPWNFLTQTQIEMPIQRVTLQDWIQQDHGRGTLIPLESGVILWDVPEVCIPTLRQQLLKADILLDWRKHLQ